MVIKTQCLVIDCLTKLGDLLVSVDSPRTNETPRKYCSEHPQDRQESHDIANALLPTILLAHRLLAGFCTGVGSSGRGKGELLVGEPPSKPNGKGKRIE